MHVKTFARMSILLAIKNVTSKMVQLDNATLEGLENAPPN